MDDSAPTLELLAWVSARPRTYEATIEAWVSNCPRLSVWDDAIEEGLVAVSRRNGGAARVVVTAAGRALLDAHVSPSG
jgi:hypothetical protein